ncbi:hypothetical protein ONS95_001390 [Cadophora gregata]|uniref:uncharacterized protein n=1 Tax=Cadophora gregata TaxID=51156 RepID=UPI0026DAA2CA|nr:uncharacterized protein ONS95_001390 [Cadophora gregata]KAK0111010.1 hypothetical protein ONS95_001390 [Cadophora gregata]KAK0112533.1 hypothetical protein ONS96_001769 [Cadophora gregata f. sp. sojae]
MYPNLIEILNQEVDPDDKTPSYYRILWKQQHIKYITIDPGIYEVDDLCFPPDLVGKLPPFPEGDWNHGRISKIGEDPNPFFSEIFKKNLPSISPLWHPRSYDYLSLHIGERLRSNVYMESSPQFEKPVVAKFARFHWEIEYYVAETRAYSWIEGHQIGPEFLGYVTEAGRVIGFLLEYIEGRHATISDLPACKTIVGQLHDLGILHGDLNKHNFLISEKGVVMIDFETAKKSEDIQVMEKELVGLEDQLLDETGNGGVVEEKEDTPRS